MAILKGPVNPVISGITTFPELDNIQVTTPNRHSVKPSLVLDFANSKTLDPRITFSRGSNATYYDGTSALAEQNLDSYSQTFTAWWTSVGASLTANATTAPDGTTTATLMYPTSTGGETILYAPAFNTTQTYTFSCYAKASGISYLILEITASTLSRTAWFNLSTGAVGTVGTSISSSSITSVGSGWYRCSITFTAQDAVRGNIGLSSGDGSYSVTASGTNGIYIWGAQLEQRSSMTAYTTTTGTPVSNYIPVLATAGPNQARFDINPITRESKGLLIEEQRTNLVTNSATFNSQTVTNATVYSNTIIAPDGTLTGSMIQDNSTNGQHGVLRTYSVISGTTYTSSVYLKMGTQRYVSLKYPSGTSTTLWATFDLLTGTVTGSWSNLGIITPVGNGWYRVSGQEGAGATASAVLELQFNSTGTNPSWPSTTQPSAYAGTGTYFYAWGMQGEAGSFATSYIPTSGASATRATDSVSLFSPNFSWFNPKEGTLYYETSKGTHLQDGRVYWQLDQGVGGAGYQQILYSSYNTGGTYYPDTQIPTGSNAAGPNKSIFAYTNQGGRSMCLNGSTVVVSTDNTYPNFTTTARLVIGAPAQACVKKLSFYPVRLTNVELQGLTKD